MCNEVILYITCTKVNVKHLSTNFRRKYLKHHTKAARSSDDKLPTQRGENAHFSTQTHRTSFAMKEKRNRPVDTSVLVRVCKGMKSRLLSFCTESMTQAWFFNRVFSHFGLRCWDQQKNVNYKQATGVGQKRVFVRVGIDKHTTKSMREYIWRK